MFALELSISTMGLINRLDSLVTKLIAFIDDAITKSGNNASEYLVTVEWNNSVAIFRTTNINVILPHLT